MITSLRLLVYSPVRRAVLATLGAGFLLRVLFLASLPPHLFRDEAEKVYTAYCLATTAHDAEGRFLPLFVHVFGVTTSAIYQYAAVPLVWLFGLNEWSARLPAAIVGTLTILALVVWARHTFDARVAVWGGLFLALSPWHVVFSRWAQQGIFLPFWLAWAMVGWQAFREGKRWGSALTGACLGVAIYTYDVARLYVPLLLVGMIWFDRREVRSRGGAAMFGLLALLICALPTVYLLAVQTEQAQARFQRISILQPGASLSSVLRAFGSNYLAHLSPRFLLLHGDPELRHSAGVGVLNWVEALALLYGIYTLLCRRAPADKLLLWWVFIFPMAASLTREGIPHALRTIVALPGVQLISGIGVAGFIERMPPLRRNTVGQLVLLAILLGFLPFAMRYYGPYRYYAAANWQYGVKQSIQILAPHSAHVERVVYYNIFGANYLVGVYAKIPPHEFSPNASKIGKYEFPPFNAPLHRLYDAYRGPTAYVTLPFYAPPYDARIVPIAPSEGADVVAVVYLNRQLWEQIRAQERVAKE